MPASRLVSPWLGAMTLVLVACGDTPTPSTDGSAAECSTSSECDDGVFCNGQERCEGTCVAGAPPCGEGEACEEDAQACGGPCSEPDADGDGRAAIACGGDDCDDADPTRYPGALEICDAEDRDEDCDMLTYGARDADGDGFVDSACCNGETCGTDCDDTRPNIHPTAPEVCDLRDGDCDGSTDEEALRAFFPDADGDGFGEPTSTPVRACHPEGRVVENDDDCDDTQAMRNPGAPEICDGLDNDCDGRIDEGRLTTYYVDGDGDGFGDLDSPLEACARPSGASDRPGDCDDTDRLRSPALPEICDGIDNDCDGAIDDDASSARWYLDADGDGYGIATDVLSSCEPLPGRSLLLGDTTASRSPVASEVCDGVDNDCDGLVDDGATGVFYRDADGDGFGVAAESVSACTRPVGHSPVAGDCDDTSRSRSPALPELCDEVDNDCDASVDEGVFVPLWYADVDRDGFGDPTTTTASCRAPEGHVATASDCDDARANRNPAAPEVCDEVDNDCDGLVDDGVRTTYYRDADGDGFGRDDAATRVQACALPVGYSVFAGDCDDTRANRNPGAPEVCDGRDNDCNGLLDAPGEDSDRDGVAGVACGGTDCDNARADVYPGAPELCDGRDNDCDGVLGTAEDVDRDGVASVACGAACTGVCGDCDDTNDAIHPAAPELCNGLDDDCNGLLDAPNEDDDRDGVADLACGAGCVGSCGDCDDTRADVSPRAAERCNGRDDDCDGLLDGPGEDDDRDGHGDVACAATCTGVCDDCDDTRADVHPGARPGLWPDGIDQDCDGLTDEIQLVSSPLVSQSGLLRVEAAGEPMWTVAHEDEQIVIHTDGSRGSLDLAMLRLTRDDLAVTQSRTYLTTDLDHAEHAPAGAWVGTDLGVVFLADTDGSWEVRYMRVSPRGVVRRAPVSITSAFGTDVFGTGHSGHPRVAYRSASDTLLVLSLSPAGRWQTTVFAAADGSIVRAPLDLGLERYAAAQATVAFDADSDTFLVVGLHSTAAGFEMRARPLRGDGSVAGPWRTLGPTTAFLYGQSYPDVVSDDGSFLVGYPTSTTHVALARVSATTTITGPVTFPFVTGDPHFHMHLHLGPEHVAFGWMHAMTYRRREDFRSVSGVYPAPSATYVAGDFALSAGVGMFVLNTTGELRGARTGCY